MDSHDTQAPPPDAVIAGPPAAAATDTRVQAGAPPAIPPAIPPAGPQRRRRWVVGVLLLLLLAAAPVAGYFFLAWQYERDLEAALADIERDDPHWRFDELMAQRPDVADADNPALVAMKVDALLRPGGYDIAPQDQRLFEAHLPPVSRLNGLQITALRESFSKRGAALQLARTLKDFRGEGRYPIKVSPDWLSTNLEPLQRTRGVMYMLYHDAMLRAEDEDGAGAMESCRACLVAARSIGLEPYLIAGLIRYAGQGMTINTLERTLAQTEPPAAELEAMQQLLAREIEAPVLVEAMRGERAGSDQLMRTLKNGDVKISALMSGPTTGSRSSVEEWLVDHLPIMVSGGRPEFLRLMNRNVEATKLPPEKQGPVYAAIEKEAKDSSAIFVRLLLPACSKVAGAHRRTQALMRCAIVALAVERYRIKHGQWPAALDDLRKDALLTAVPVDPCDGQPLRYKALPDGVLVYSVGMDGTDNGGAIDRVNPVGPGVDLGFQLWEVSARRQAPLPPPPPPED